MEHRVLGWPPDGPRVKLDHRAFAYAGKFVTADTGVAVTTDSTASSVTATPEDADDPPTPRTTPPADRSILEPTNVVGAVAFNADRTAPTTLWFRYVTVRRDRRGEAIAGRLCAFVCARAADRYERVRIAVNNPFSYDALHKAGFRYTGEKTGLAELVLTRPTDRPASSDPATYRDGLDTFRDRDLSAEEAAFCDRAIQRGPPDRLVG